MQCLPTDKHLSAYYGVFMKYTPTNLFLVAFLFFQSCALDTNWPDIISSLKPAIFTVECGNSSGSGFLVNKNIIATNYHVISNCDESNIIVQRASDDFIFDAIIIAYDIKRNLALLSTTGISVKPIKLSSDVNEGDEVLLIGNPIGTDFPVSKAIISAIKTEDDLSIIQTDAAINSDNSGGPIISKDGSAVGMAVLKISSIGTEGIGFGISSKHISDLLNKKEGVWITQNGDSKRTNVYIILSVCILLAILLLILFLKHHLFSYLIKLPLPPFLSSLFSKYRSAKNNTINNQIDLSPNDIDLHISSDLDSILIHINNHKYQLAKSILVSTHLAFDKLWTYINKWYSKAGLLENSLYLYLTNFHDKLISATTYIQSKKKIKDIEFHKITENLVDFKKDIDNETKKAFLISHHIEHAIINYNNKNINASRKHLDIVLNKDINSAFLSKLSRSINHKQKEAVNLINDGILALKQHRMPYKAKKLFESAQHIVLDDGRLNNLLAKCVSEISHFHKYRNSSIDAFENQKYRKASRAAKIALKHNSDSDKAKDVYNKSLNGLKKSNIKIKRLFLITFLSICLVLLSIYFIKYYLSIKEFNNVMSIKTANNQYDPKIEKLDRFIMSNHLKKHKILAQNELNKLLELKEQNTWIDIRTQCELLEHRSEYYNAISLLNNYISHYSQSPYTLEAKKMIKKIKEASHNAEYKVLITNDYKSITDRIIKYEDYISNNTGTYKAEQLSNEIQQLLNEYLQDILNQIENDKSDFLSNQVFIKHRDFFNKKLENACFPSERSQINDFIASGDESLSNGKYSEARRYYRNALEICNQSKLVDFHFYKKALNIILGRLEHDDFLKYDSGFIRYEGKWYNKDDYEKKMRSIGMLKHNGVFVNKREYYQRMFNEGYVKYFNKFIKKTDFANNIVIPKIREISDIGHIDKFNNLTIYQSNTDIYNPVFITNVEAITWLSNYSIVQKISIESIYNYNSDNWIFKAPYVQTDLVTYK